MEKPIFPILDRILRRVNLNEQQLPQDVAEWQEFLNRVNNCFVDFEQERYLLERSMEISSREMLELNERFETAEKIAHIGHWVYNHEKENIFWSKETYRIFDLEPSSPVPKYDFVMQKIHEDDRLQLSRLIKRALYEGKDYDMEIRILEGGKKIRWAYVKGQPAKKKNNEKSEYKTNIIHGIIMDITERKNSEDEVRVLNQKIISVARRAGMSEVATSVLHNVGNILNSINISLSMIQEVIKESDVENLKKISQMINDNIQDNPKYLISDQKGKLIPKYLEDLATNLSIENEEVNNEVKRLATNIKHIKDIVSMQKDISGISGIVEKIFLPELIDVAIQMSCNSPEKHGIIIMKNYEIEPFLYSDKSKILQILVNLIQNAKESLEMNLKGIQKFIKITIMQKSKSLIEIRVEDNGVGIEKENLIKIFSMGFSTKPTGHGFGLHSCAIAANELNGSLSVISEGAGKGALFVLKIPKKQYEEEKT